MSASLWSTRDTRSELGSLHSRVENRGWCEMSDCRTVADSSQVQGGWNSPVVRVVRCGISNNSVGRVERLVSEMSSDLKFGIEWSRELHRVVNSLLPLREREVKWKNFDLGGGRSDSCGL